MLKIIKLVFTLILSALLIFSFGLHTIEVKHEHHGYAHSHTHDQPTGMMVTIGEYQHGIEKKLFLVILLMFILAGASLLHPLQFLQTLSVHTLFLIQNFLYHSSLRLPHFDYLVRLFSAGMLNPKLH